MSVNRRQFIQMGAGAAGAVALSGLTSHWWGLDANPVHDPGTEGDTVIPTFCELCFWKCGVLAHVKDGRVTKLKGNPAHPLSRGKLCPRGTGGVETLYDPDRLRKPLIRSQKRGEDVFLEASWEQALDKVAENLIATRDKYGPEALALFTHGFGGSWFNHLMGAFGSPNIGAPSYAQCRGPREVGYYLTYGTGFGSPEPIDIENTKCLVLIGSHLGENMHNTQVQEFARAIERGAQLVVVDPRFSTAAGKARYWLPIKPGTDIALLLAWINVIVTEQRYDTAYLDKYAIGLEDLKTHVADKTPEWAYPHTGLHPDLIRDSARFLASFRPATLVHPGRRVVWYGDDAQRARAMAILGALLGSYGRQGGYLVPSKMKMPKYHYPKYKGAPKKPVDRVGNKYPLADEILASGLCDASIPGTADYDIKSWMVYGTNLLQTLPDPRHTLKAIQAVDFIVAIDILPVEICGWSDVVLPESTYLERWDDLYVASYKQPFVALRQAVVEPMYDSKPGWWIAKELGTRLGLGEYFEYESAQQVVEARLKEGGYSVDVIKKTGVILGKPHPTCEEEGLALAFDTESGKIELKSNALAGLGFDPMPQYTPPDEPPAGMFRLITGRSPVHSFGRTTNNRFLGLIHPENELWVNADVAKELPGMDGPLQSGDKVVLINQDEVRSNPVTVKVTQRIRGDCVFMVHGFGHRAKGLTFAAGRGASDTDLITQYKVDPLMGGTAMSVNFVRLERAPESAT